MTLTLINRHDAPRASREGQPKVTVLVDRCAGCQECLVRCPTEALDLDIPTWTVYTDDTKCVGCRQCERSCPFSAISVEGPCTVSPRSVLANLDPQELLGNLSETRQGIRSWSEAIAEASRCLGCPDPTCVRGCPAHNNIPAFVEAVRHGDLDAAHAVLRKTSFLPDICSRVCDQAVQCEGSCTWSLAGDKPVAIGALERFVADNAPVPPLAVRAFEDGAEMLEVAVIGSGPAGLAAASELVQGGASVTVFEKDDHAGGLLRWGIPDFTLPAEVAERPVETLRSAGVEFRFGTEINPENVAALTDTFDAVVVAAGASKQIHLSVPGSDLEGVWGSTDYLKQAREALVSGRPLDIGVNSEGRTPVILVLGAGNTAMDVARSARRLGSEAICVDWMDPRFAPVRPDELAEARHEGVEVRFNTTLQRIEGLDGRARAVWLARTRQEKASRLPQIVKSSSERIEVDLVVMAMGYRIEGDVAALSDGPLAREVPTLPDRRWIGSGILATSPEFARGQPVGRLALGRESLRQAAAQPRAERVWAVGDALSGPSTVVEAMAQGKTAAARILIELPSRPRLRT